MGGKGVVERSRTEENPGLKKTEAGWVDSSDGGCHEKGWRGVGRTKVIFMWC